MTLKEDLEKASEESVKETDEQLFGCEKTKPEVEPESKPEE